MAKMLTKGGRGANALPGAPAARRTASSAWIERVNPLHGLSIQRAQWIFDAGREHGSPTLQKIYDEIERTDPVLLTCVERRTSAVSGMGWEFKAEQGADETLANEQRDAIRGFVNGIEDFAEAIEHLELSFFRGYSHVQPIWDGNAVRRIALLDSWNMLRDADGGWWWDPECLGDIGQAESTEGCRLVTVARRRAIDWPCLTIFIRKTLGEREWGRFVERYGIPPVDVVMPPNATNEQRGDFVQASDDARDGRSTVWPNGTTTSRAEGARGQDPFTPFVEHQEKLVVLLCTGGTLTSLAQANTGSLAGGAQMDVWREIVRKDAAIISSAVNRQLVRPFLEAAFPGRPVVASFELGGETEPTPAEVFEMGAKARSAGFTIAQDELEEATGYTLEKDASGALPGMAGALMGKARLQTAPGSFKTACKKPDGQGDLPDGEGLEGAFLDAMAKAMAEELEAE